MPWISKPKGHRCKKPAFEEIKKTRQHRDHYWQCSECDLVWSLYWFWRMSIHNPKFEGDATVRWNEVRMKDGVENL